MERVSFFDTKVVINKKGEEEIVPVWLPQCCREGWPDCPHVPKKQRKIKVNIGV